MKPIKLLTLCIAIVSIIPGTRAQDNSNQNQNVMKFTLQPLPYAINALEPTMSQETLEYHWGKHLKAYIDKTNELIAGTPYENMDLESIIRKADGPLFNNAAQVWNHEFFFSTLSPHPKARPEGKLMDQIVKDFGSFDKFKEDLNKAGAGLFGSGWVWLVYKDGKLALLSKQNAGTPLTDNATALIGTDVWEHAYYLDFRNRRPDYLQKLWDLVDWGVVEKRFDEIK